MSESRKVGPWFCVGPIHVRLVDGKWEVYSQEPFPILRRGRQRR